MTLKSCARILSSSFPSCLPYLASPFLLHSFLSSQPHCTGHLRWFTRSSVQSFSCVQLFMTPWTAAHQTSLSITSSRACSNSCPSSQWCHPTISSSVVPFSPAFNLSQYKGLLQWVSSSHQVAKVLKFQLQHQSFQWIFRTDFLYLASYRCG